MLQSQILYNLLYYIFQKAKLTGHLKGLVRKMERGSARAGDSILITGKSTDPYIMGSRGKKEPWDDMEMALEELKKM